ncbi:MAG: acyl-CoA thioesterase [Thermoguttaceae bacterium]|nr:acyl-CoA thioesterase [Thermoguttaceae bacterium]
MIENSGINENSENNGNIVGGGNNESAESADSAQKPTVWVPTYARLIEVSETDVDVWGHANNVCYVHWMQDVAVAHSAAIGWSAQRYLDYGAIWVVRRHTIEYRQSAYRGEKILAQTWIAEMKNVTCLRRYRFLRLPNDVDAANFNGFMENADDFPKSAILATAETLWGFVSTGTPRPARVAPELREAFEKTVVQGGVRFPKLR